MVSRLRFLIQNLAFFVLMYGGRYGLSLGHSLPCFACPYVSGCAGHCYLMALQSHMGLAMPVSAFLTQWGLRALLLLGLFLL